jgi:short-subunit dehydrogenase
MALPPPAPDGTCVVTGASSGIGVELARQLAGRGHGVTLVARRGHRLTRLAEQLRDDFGVRAEVVTADLADPCARAALPHVLACRGLSVAVLVNNAGLGSLGPVTSADRDVQVGLVRLDVEAVVDMCGAFLPGMVARGTGAVLNVASTSAFQPMPGMAAYAAAKSFVLSYSRALRAELAGTGVTVSVLCPGPVETEFAEVAGFSERAAATAMPRAAYLPAPAVARAGLDGLARGRAVVVPGWVNRLGATVGHLVPRRVTLGFLAKVQAERAEPQRPD